MGDGLATIELDSSYVFLGADGTRQLMILMENPETGAEVATVAPAAEDEYWLLVFEWEPIGYVDDSEGSSIDAHGILQSVIEGTEIANRERRERGWAVLEIVGWEEEPHYDARTNNLTWAIQGRSEGVPMINRNIKLLGRRGVITATLIADPEELAMASAEVDRLLDGFAFQPGNRYAEFVPGKDDLAKIGLTALIAGRAGAALAKTGILARFGKLIALGVLAVIGAVARFLTRILRGSQAGSRA